MNFESQIYNWGIKRDVSLDGAQPVNKDSSRDISSDTSNNNIHNGKINVKSEQTKKGVTTKSEVAPFAFENGSTKTMPQIREKDGMRIIGANKVIDENAFVEGMWGEMRR